MFIKHILTTATQPFDLDYFQVLFTLCDILAEVYSKILSFVGPSSSAGASAFPGFPQPPSSTSNQGATHVFQSIYPATVSASGVSVYAIPSSERRQGVGLSPMLLEVVMKIDTRLKVCDTHIVVVIQVLTIMSLSENHYLAY